MRLRDRTMAEITLEMSEFDLEMLLRTSGVSPPWGQASKTNDDESGNDDRYATRDDS
jgi:hypothetical protein